MRRKDINRKPFAFAEYPLLFAHRGCSKAAPENTIAAFQKILDNNIPGAELDVQMCKSGEIVVVHDLNLKRTTGFDALVEETELAEIKKQDAGSWFDKYFAGEKIPTLDEVFELLGTSVYYDIEIKHTRKKHGELEKKLVEKIHQWNFDDRVIISSFNPIAILGVRKADPQFNTAIIYCSKETIPWWLHNGAGKYICSPNILKPCKQKINPFTMFIIKKLQGYNIVSWTIDDPVLAEKNLDQGVHGIITNAPEDMLEMVRKRWDS